jgi:Fungalysin/Thermolysin Propeptide Motif
MRLRARIAAAAVLAATVALPFPAFAKQPHAPSLALQILPDEAEASSRTEAGRVSALTGRPLSLYRVNFAVRPGTPEQMAREYLVARASQLGLPKADASDLRVVGTRVGEASTTVAFEQTYQGLPVYGSDTTVSMNRQNLITFVMNGTKAVSLPDVAPTVSMDDARARVLDHLRPQGSLQLDRRDLVVYHAKGASRLAYRFRMVPTVAPSGDWEALVDAKTGELFRVADLSCYREDAEPLVPVNGTATVFTPDPLSSSGGTVYGTGGFVDGADADTPDLTGQLVGVTLLDIDLTGGIHTLKGPFAEIVDTEAPFKGLFTQASSSFNSTRFPDVFEAAFTYYHIDRFMRYINTPSGSGGLGLTVLPTQYVGGVRFDPHGLSGADNSHYTPGTGQLAFGEGGVDDDEDADVVIHELGHGLHDWVTAAPGVSQVNGLSEGTGDYFAQSYSRAYGNVPSANPAWHWTFSWDGHNPFWPGRVTNYAATYPGGLVGQVHTDGQIWATCLMRIWNQLGAVKTDRVVLAGLALTNSSTNQDDAAQALMQAAFDLGYPLADQQIMLAEFTATGYTVVIVPVELMSAGVE